MAQIWIWVRSIYRAGQVGSGWVIIITMIVIIIIHNFHTAMWS